MSDKKYSLMIARFPAMGQEHPDSAGWIMGLQGQVLSDPRISRVQPFVVIDTPVTMCRNKCVKTAIACDCDYILMIDADMSPDCEAGAPGFWKTAWDFMIDRRDRELEIDLAHQDAHGGWAPIPDDQKLMPATIGAPYCGNPPHEAVYVFHWATRENVGERGSPNMQLSQYTRDHVIGKKGIEEVAALATGLILYDTRVFRKLPQPWFEYEYSDPPCNTEKITTEDVYQTRNASMIGLPQFIAWDCWSAHMKTKKVCKPRGLAITDVRDTFAESCIRAMAARRGTA